MGSYFFMRVAWARRRRAATLMKKYEPMTIPPRKNREGMTIPPRKNREGMTIPPRFLRGGMTFLPRLLNNQAKYSYRWEKHGYS